MRSSAGSGSTMQMTRASQLPVPEFEQGPAGERQMQRHG
jgi:hypothetical protein